MAQLKYVYIVPILLFLLLVFWAFLEFSGPLCLVHFILDCSSKSVAAGVDQQYFLAQSAAKLQVTVSNMGLLSRLLWLGSLVLPSLAASQPAVPLSSESRWIVDTSGNRVKFRCINWAGHMEANIPEGLHRQSVDYVAGWIANQGFNCVRLTYSIDMALNQTMTVQDSFINAASAANVSLSNMTDLYNQAVQQNPFLASATVIDVFDAVQSALWSRGVMTILDNHVSRAQWCCDIDDGNGWWASAPGYWAANSEYFITQQWLDGLQAMAKWTNSRPGIVAMSLRNELRAQVTQFPFAPSIWLQYMPNAANQIHAANPNLLIVAGGINGGTDLTPLRTTAMNTGNWTNKHVWEAHVYSYTVLTPNLGSCAAMETEYGALFGFVLEQDDASVGPLWLSEFGVGMTGGDHDGLDDQDYAYLACLVSYMENIDADWSLWAVQGSYYVRQGTVDSNETWGALDYSWTDWRNPDFKDLLGGMWNITQGPGV
jgi:endoglucanase